MKTMKAVINIGINEGYFNDNEYEGIDFAAILSKFLEDNCESVGEYIPFIVYPVKTVYRQLWGCPKYGEVTYVLTATANLEFTCNLEVWQMEVIEYVRRLKEHLKQSTVTLEFHDVDLVYFKDGNIID